MGTIKINNWAMVTKSLSPYHAPEQGIQCLNGNVENHPRHEPGKNVDTTEVIGQTAESYIVTRSGSVYELGEPAPAYEKAFPNAKQRVLASLPKL